jgi:hypothetical protein
MEGEGHAAALGGVCLAAPRLAWSMTARAEPEAGIRLANPYLFEADSIRPAKQGTGRPIQVHSPAALCSFGLTSAFPSLARRYFRS